MSKSTTYLIYILFWETLVWGGIGCAVFVMGDSGWWFLLAFAVSASAYRPEGWIHGDRADQYRRQND